MTLETHAWDIIDYLDSPEAISGYLTAVLEDKDPDLLLAALGDIARAKGLVSLATEAGLSLDTISQLPSHDGKPGFAMIVKVMDALDLQLQVRPKSDRRPEAA